MTPREREIAALRRQGFGLREIADRLKISPQTVRKHRDNYVRRDGYGSELRTIVEREPDGPTATA